MKYKYIIFVLLSFLVASPAYGAKTVQGTVPQTQPFLKPNVFVNPNVEGNVQFHDASHIEQPGSQQKTQPLAQPSSQEVVGAAPAGIFLANNTYLVFWIFVIFTILAAGLWLVQKKKR